MTLSSFRAFEYQRTWDTAVRGFLEEKRCHASSQIEILRGFREPRALLGFLLFQSTEAGVLEGGSD